MIHVENVTLFPEKKCPIPILENLSFAIEANQCFGLVGPSGCGKSTILRTLCSLHPYWTGKISIDGVPLTSTSQVVWNPFKKGPRPTTQMVFQDPYASLHPKQTVYQILQEPLKIQKIPHTEDTLLQAIEDVSLAPEHLFRYPHELSGGQRQRVSLARSLLLSPKVLLLDECTSALDASVQKEILLLIKQFQKKRSMTCVLVSHSLPVIHFMCDRYLSL